MGLIQRSALLFLLRQRLAEERTADWQSLHLRDRNWHMQQPDAGKWQKLRAWLTEFGRNEVNAELPWSTLAVLGGFFLVAGLVEFQTFERINLLLFFLFSVILPLLSWLLGLVIFRRSALLTGLIHRRLPQWREDASLQSLLRHTARFLGQQFSLFFAVGAVSGFLLYILLTDLAFGWSSTVSVTAEALFRVTSTIALPWKSLWPDAVPSLELIHQTHYFRSAPEAVSDAATLGEWWRFLLMSLLTYTLLPRMVSFVVSYLGLAGMQSRLVEGDALIAGLLQRMGTEVVNQEYEEVEQNSPHIDAVATTVSLPACDRILRWGSWPEPDWQRVEAMLHKALPGVGWAPLLQDKQQESSSDTPNATLLICKGWEPPTGELSDLCQALNGDLFLWPVSLQGMSAGRIELCNDSWRAFMGQLPARFRLVLGERDG